VLGCRTGAATPAHRSSPCLRVNHHRRRASRTRRAKPAPVSPQEGCAVPAGDVRHNLRSALTEHGGAGVTQLAGDPLRMFAGGEPPWRPGRPRLGEGAGPEAHPFPGCRPAPPPQRGDGDGPACLMQTALIAAPPRLPAGPPEPIVDRLEPLEVATTRRSRGPSLVLAGPSLAHGDCASHEGDVSPCERDRRVGTPARRACHMDIRPSVRGDLAHERRALLGGDGVDRRRWTNPVGSSVSTLCSAASWRLVWRGPLLFVRLFGPSGRPPVPYSPCRYPIRRVRGVSLTWPTGRAVK